MPIKLSHKWWAGSIIRVAKRAFAGINEFHSKPRVIVHPSSCHFQLVVRNLF